MVIKNYIVVFCRHDKKRFLVFSFHIQTTLTAEMQRDKYQILVFPDRPDRKDKSMPLFSPKVDGKGVQ